MNYFCNAHIQSGAKQEKRLFIVLEPNGEDIPLLTKEKLLSVGQYMEFVQTYKPRLIMIDYTVYSTESEVYASMQDEEFLKLIEDGNTEKLASSELRIEGKTDKNTVRKKKALSPVGIALIIGCVLIVGMGSFGLGKMLGGIGAVQETTDNAASPDKDGLLIPEQVQLADDVEQITVTIDRSYSAIPTEDLQLKGAIVDGAAQITLPEFDKTDFFTHVEGYTWGFTSDPDGDKIEYYGGATYSFSADTKLYRVLVKYGGGSIQGSAAGNIILNTELAAGGIAGEETTSAENAMISNCYATDLQLSCGVFSDESREVIVKKGATGGIIGMDGSEGNGHAVINTVSPDDLLVIGTKAVSAFDDTVRIAPSYAYYQENILSVINRNTVSEKEPGEIFTGSFTFGNGELSDNTGSLAYPEEIKDLFEKTVAVEDSNE